MPGEKVPRRSERVSKGFKEGSSLTVKRKFSQKKQAISLSLKRVRSGDYEIKSVKFEKKKEGDKGVSNNVSTKIKQNRDLEKTVTMIKKLNKENRPNKHKYYKKAINKFLSTGIISGVSLMTGEYPIHRKLLTDKFFAAVMQWYFFTNKQDDGKTSISWGQMKNFRGYLGATLAMKNLTWNNFPLAKDTYERIKRHPRFKN